ncbi:lysosomal thioesterase PPT2-A-like [Physella acuta]|uniref:lysosomal thioesterase PPT2-A-like n=1 Tax=Physella acuta TaxID=109671 RepID=UPI0027DAD7D0|nr:lysosomal thioesterase PPT2-A-like [Physella acuta]
MASQAMGYKHIIFMHGILAGPSEFDYYNQLVQQYHPGTPSTQVNLYNYKDSIVDMWTQVVKIADTVRPILLNTSSEGTILVCFSQGGLICRALLATINHNVQTFISLSAPLAGQYGDSEYLKYFFPNLLKENAYKLFYTPMGQDVSIGSYWNDPRQQKMFKEFSNFLAVLNNQSTVVNPKSQEFRSNFLRLKNLVLVGGPDDGVITPWESSQFGMYNATDAVLPMEEQEWYQNDAFGLKTMNTQGRILKFVFKGIQHRHWHSELQVFEKCIKPWL